MEYSFQSWLKLQFSTLSITQGQRLHEIAIITGFCYIQIVNIHAIMYQYIGICHQVEKFVNLLQACRDKMHTVFFLVITLHIKFKGSPFRYG